MPVMRKADKITLANPGYSRTGKIQMLLSLKKQAIKDEQKPFVYCVLVGAEMIEEELIKA